MTTPHLRSSMRSPVLGTLRIGGDLQAKLAKATKLSESDGQGSRSISYDLNGDGTADVWESDTLDANGAVTSRGLSVYANGATYSAADNNADGKIDTLSRSSATGYSLLSAATATGRSTTSTTPG